MIEKNNFETLLTKAVIDKNRELMKRSFDRSELYRVNGLGFNAIELARLLCDRESLQWLGDKDPPSPNNDVMPEDGGVYYHPHLTFADYDTLKTVIRCTPKWVQDGALKDRYHPCLEKHVTIQWIDKILCYGVFAAEPIKKEEFVGEYTGVVKLKPKFRQYDNPYSLRYPQKMFSWRYAVIDCESEGNFTRYINHSDDPNLTPMVSIDRGVIHSLFFARRDIAKGEQLTWNYGPDYWIHRGPPREI